MATAGGSNMPGLFEHDHTPPTDDGTDASTPPSPQVLCGDPTPAESITNAPIPVIRLPSRLPPGHPRSPPPAYSDDFRGFPISSPTPPPEYCCSPGMATNRDESASLGEPHGFAHRGAPLRRTPDSTHDHQPVIAMDTHRAPRQDAHVNPLHYCMVGVIIVGLFVATTMLLIDSPGGPFWRQDTVKPEQEPPRPARHPPRMSPYGMDEFGKEDDAEVAPPGSDEEHSLGVQASAANGPFRQADSSANTSTLANGDDDMRDAEPIDPNAPQLRQDCSHYYYTYCTRPRTIAFHYDPEELACVPSTALATQLCNRGTNRFSSWEGCRAGCLQPGLASDMCFEDPLFMPCSKQDVTTSFWYYNGTACTEWTFPHGRCPASQPVVYRTLGECSLQCMEIGGQVDSLRCGVPDEGECGLEYLRHPYFADIDADGSARCVNASHATLVDLRCLFGNNQFDSMEACQRTCQG
ncbi:hypothetical protein HPB50_013309 [Hyalomma asiaticum]|uniref:Uncharacterized protein n=1 Tax=Hyalomma asiaticum TaxID=266040 RepID=A0ACB7TM26_HYAAI|nr:hypothetical protein HPB50_013309 [Hyalomma asiaticum]